MDITVGQGGGYLSRAHSSLFACPARFCEPAEAAPIGQLGSMIAVMRCSGDLQLWDDYLYFAAELSQTLRNRFQCLPR